jgi:two-component system response regulator PilR (NtrC family)
VRELENIVERAVTLETTPVIQRTRSPISAASPPPPRRPATCRRTASISIGCSPITRASWWARRCARPAASRREAARLLGITFRSLRYRLAKLGLATGGDAGDSGVMVAQPDEEAGD